MFTGRDFSLSVKVDANGPVSPSWVRHMVLNQRLSVDFNFIIQGTLMALKFLFF